jgi:DNA-binding MarR family transcriptional regulator
MNRKNAGRELMESFIRMVNKYNAMEKHPVSYGTKHEFYHSERHMLDLFGDNPELNITELAQHTGVTKGAISQVVSKLEDKGAVLRYKEGGNEKDVLVRLTRKGEEIYEHHKKINEKTVSQLQSGMKDYSDENISCLLDMFKWIEEYLDESKKQMENHGQREE